MMVGICGVMIDMEEFSYDFLGRTLEKNGVNSSPVMDRLNNIITWHATTDGPLGKQAAYEFVRARTRAVTKAPFSSWAEVGRILAKNPELIHYLETGELP